MYILSKIEPVILCFMYILHSLPFTFSIMLSLRLILIFGWWLVGCAQSRTWCFAEEVSEARGQPGNGVLLGGGGTLELASAVFINFLHSLR